VPLLQVTNISLDIFVITKILVFVTFSNNFFKEIARGGERTRVLSISFIFSFFTTLPLSHSGSPFKQIFTYRGATSLI
jgi:hypothetical protein